jgi:hypothetical protein
MSPNGLEFLTTKTHDQDAAISGQQWHNQSGSK